MSEVVVTRMKVDKKKKVCEVLNEVWRAGRMDVGCVDCSFDTNGYHAKRIEKIFMEDCKGSIQDIRIGYLRMGVCDCDKSEFWISTDSGYTTTIEKDQIQIMIEALNEMMYMME